MPQKNPILSIVVFLVIVAGAVGALFLVLRPGTTDNAGKNSQANQPTVNPTTIATVTPLTTASPSATVTPSITVTPTATVTLTALPTLTPVVSATPPAGWQPIVNDIQGYTAYRPTGWYFRLFSPNKFALGLDPAPIPTASEYMGVMSLMRLSASNNFDSYLTQLETGYTSTSREISGRTWTMVEGKTKANEIFDSKYVKYGKVTIESGKEFLARIESATSDFGSNAAKFESFITTIQFN